MPPAKRKPIVKEKPKVVKKTGLCFCKLCNNKSDEVYPLVFKCLKGVNAPYGNHSLYNCLWYDDTPPKNDEK